VDIINICELSSLKSNILNYITAFLKKNLSTGTASIKFGKYFATTSTLTGRWRPRWLAGCAGTSARQQLFTWLTSSSSSLNPLPKCLRHPGTDHLATYFVTQE
jgi:hypothetical protein